MSVGAHRLVVVIGPPSAAPLLRAVTAALGRRRGAHIAVEGALGARDEAADARVSAADLVVVATPSGAPEGLAAVAAIGAAELASAVCPVTFSVSGVRWPWRHRATTAAVCSALS